MAMSVETYPNAGSEPVGVADCVSFPEGYSTRARGLVLAFSIIAGSAGGVFLSGLAEPTGALWICIGFAAFAGGLLSTWSPCGYSSISLLRPTGQGMRALRDWLPTFTAHGAGYALGAVLLGGLLGAIGIVAGFVGFASTFGLGILSAIGLIYGAHQLDLLRVPYPQRRAQVPHDARHRFPKWVVGGIYGLALGLDYLTYVQTPLLYMATAAAILTGSLPEAILIVVFFNLGRYAPMGLNLLPVTDHAIQAWLGRNQERAALVDGGILLALGAAFGIVAAI